MFRVGLSTTHVALIGTLALSVNTAWGASDEPVGPSQAARTATPFEMVEPILEARCVRCHGLQNTNADLRLDAPGASRDIRFAARNPAKNELFARIVATDPTVRMPLGSPPLTDAEVAAFRAWIEAGQPWPSPPAVREAAALAESHWIESLRDHIDWLWPRGVLAIVLMVGILAFERLKVRSRAGSWPRWGEWRERFGQEAYLAVLSTVMLAGVIHIYHARVLWLEQRLAAARVQLATEESDDRTVIRTAPSMVRPNVPKRLQATYYRGNCERNEKLFNGGNYCTAYLRLALYGSSDRPLAAGDDVTDQDLSVEFEIEKAPGATDTLFTKAIMSTVGVTTQNERQPAEDRTPTVPPKILEETHPERRWKVRVPVGRVGAGGNSGVLYVCKGNIPHYGIQYDLKTVDGRLTGDSDLWMAAVYLPSRVALPTKLPYREWLDHEPLPAITEPNSTDATLLGIPEHLPETERDAPSR